MFVSSFLFIAFAFSPAANGRALDKRQDGSHWVDTWTSMPQLVEQSNMPPSPFVRCQRRYMCITSTNVRIELRRRAKKRDSSSDSSHVRGLF
jgi:hypothetical protein